MTSQHTSSAGWPALAALALAVLFACVAEEGGESAWFGVIRDTCGPADGPALMIRIEDHPVASCGDTTRPDTATGLYRLYIPDLLVDSLRPGMVLKDTFSHPDGYGYSVVPLTFTVESVTPTTVTGRLKTETFRNGNPQVNVQGRVTLSVCPRQFPICLREPVRKRKPAGSALARRSAPPHLPPAPSPPGAYL